MIPPRAFLIALLRVCKTWKGRATLIRSVRKWRAERGRGTPEDAATRGSEVLLRDANADGLHFPLTADRRDSSVKKRSGKQIGAIGSDGMFIERDGNGPRSNSVPANIKQICAPLKCVFNGARDLVCSIANIQREIRNFASYHRRKYYHLLHSRLQKLRNAISPQGRGFYQAIVQRTFCEHAVPFSAIRGFFSGAALRSV